MRTARSSSRLGGGRGLVLIPWICPLGVGLDLIPWICPLGVGLDLIPLNFPLGCGPRSDPPQFPPWLWAWIFSSSISPLVVGLDLIPLNFTLGCGPGPDPPQFPPWVWDWRGVSTRHPLPLCGGLLFWWPSAMVMAFSPPQKTIPEQKATKPGIAPPPFPWTEFLTHAYENITLPQTSFAGGKNSESSKKCHQ